MVLYCIGCTVCVIHSIDCCGANRTVCLRSVGRSVGYVWVLLPTPWGRKRATPPAGKASALVLVQKACCWCVYPFLYRFRFGRPPAPADETFMTLRKAPWIFRNAECREEDAFLASAIRRNRISDDDDVASVISRIVYPAAVSL